MKEQVSSRGFNLHMVKVNEWIFDDYSGDLFDGTFASVALHTIKLGFTIASIEMAVSLILQSDMDSVHFGINKLPMFAFNLRNKNEVA